ncbi:hypothetical protein BH18THE2_BH18THE2_08260 [soil metagenome]
MNIPFKIGYAIVTRFPKAYCCWNIDNNESSILISNAKQKVTSAADIEMTHLNLIGLTLFLTKK